MEVEPQQMEHSSLLMMEMGGWGSKTQESRLKKCRQFMVTELCNGITWFPRQAVVKGTMGMSSIYIVSDGQF